MDAQRKDLLRRLMALEFTAIDLNLYLDTHPDDHKALADYNAISMELRAVKMEYEKLYGPLVHYGYSPSPGAWRWIDEPWPWEIMF